MTSPGPTTTPASAPFWHAALVYADEREFLAGAVPYLREGLRAGERLLVVTSRPNVEALRQRLGGHEPAIEYADSIAWYSAPGPTLTAYDDYMREHTRNGRRVRILGEPPWREELPLQRQAWQRYEALLNVACRHHRAHTLCPYDARALDRDILATAQCTHPTLLTPEGTRASEDYVDAADFCARLDEQPLPQPGGPVEQVVFTAADLARVRAFVAETAERAGLPPIQADELVVAVNEITGNAVRHGGGLGRLRAWREDHHLVFEVDDAGTAHPDPLAGYVRRPPDAETTGGYGLWLARQLCDLVEVRHGPGWLVRLYTAVRR